MSAAVGGEQVGLAGALEGVPAGDEDVDDDGDAEDVNFLVSGAHLVVGLVEQQLGRAVGPGAALAREFGEERVVHVHAEAEVCELDFPDLERVGLCGLDEDVLCVRNGYPA